MNYLVVTMFNPKNNQNIFAYQKSRTEYKIKSQISYTSYSTDYVWGKYELARTCFCYMINGYNLVTNNLGYEFAYSIHTGTFSELIEPEEEPPVLSARCSPMRTAYEEEPITRTENVILEPIEEPSILTRTENVIIKE